MAAPLILALALIQAPTQAAVPGLTDLALSGDPVLASGIEVLVEVPSRHAATDAWGCIQRESSYCRHEAVVTEDGRPVGPTRSVRMYFSSFAGATFRRAGLYSAYVFNPDCDTYESCGQFARQQRELMEPRHYYGSGEQIHSWVGLRVGKELAAAKARPESTGPREGASSGRGTTSSTYGSSRGGYRGGPSGGGVTMSGNTGGRSGAGVTSTTHRSSGGSDRTGTAGER